MLWLLSGPPGFACWISFALIFGFVCCWVLVFALSPFCVLVCVFWEMMHGWVGGLSCGPGICVSWSTSGLEVGLARRETGISPPVKYFADLFGAVLLLWIVCVVCVFCLSCFRVCSLLHCGRLKGRS